jgi:hypothetical protein
MKFPLSNLKTAWRHGKSEPEARVAARLKNRQRAAMPRAGPGARATWQFDLKMK